MSEATISQLVSQLERPTQSLDLTLPGLAFGGSPDAQAKLVAALALASIKFDGIEKAKRAGKEGEKFSFMYAPLPEILRIVRQPLAENGLVLISPPVTASPGSGYLRQYMILAHSGGATISSWLDYPSLLDCQRPNEATKEFGKAATYVRRYLLNGLLCLSGGEDADDDNAKPDAPRGSVAAPKLPVGNDVPPTKEELSQALPVREEKMTREQQSQINKLARALKLASPEALFKRIERLVGVPRTEMTVAHGRVIIEDLSAELATIQAAAEEGA